MSKLVILLLSLAVVVFSPPSLAQDRNPTSVAGSGSVYDELKSRGFPIGLLPTNVASYSLNRTTGDFAVDLDGHCQILLPPDNYLAAYSQRIEGKIVDRKIAGLDGIRVWAFFKWWSISGIRLSGDDLVFEVGVASAKYPANNFDEIPECDGGNKKKASS